MRNASAFDQRLAALAGERETHRQDRLQRITLRTAGRTDIGFARADPNRIIDDVGDRPGGDAGSVVGDANCTGGGIDADREGGCDLLLLAGVDRVIREFLQDYERPFGRRVPDLGGQFALPDESKRRDV
jgi:hypothetical protein